VNHKYAWGSYLLYPSAAEQGRPEPELVEVEWEHLSVINRWPLHIIIKNLVWDAYYFHLAQPKEAKILTAMQQWIDQTESLADRVPFRGLVPEAMRHAAEGLRLSIQWRTRYFHNPPSEIGTRREAERRCSEALWALDTLIRRWNEAERDPEWLRQRGESASLEVVETLKLKITTVWPTYFANVLPEPPAFADYEQADRRIARVRSDIKPGLEEALMEHLLSETLANGRFSGAGPREDREIAH
jgi:hypothetical protein